ncbi:NeuD/PglB/VioB family sugar acetyltransferase [Aeromonas rivipollensis]|uniref:NeuD/PglB/VioB family sugar acetyltransferase n=1 Tax=Aeromonas rivipollensis TaxID=948519 RepID=UPI0038D1DDC8
MKKIIGVYGAGGYGREVLPLIREKFKCELNNIDIFFVVDQPDTKQVNGIDVIDFEGFISISSEDKYICIAIADSKVREILEQKCRNYPIKKISISASNVVIMDKVDISDGYILSPFVCLTSNIKIGKSFHANIYSYVAHDCIIGDYVTFAPGVKCNGNVVIEDHAYIGTGAIIRPGTSTRPITIGRGAIVGMGAVVTKSVPEGATVFGNPAKVIGK